MILPSPAEFRARLIASSMNYMSHSMGIANSDLDRVKVAATKERWIEFAHTPHLPHVGTARSFISAYELARRNDACLVFFLNDHLAPRDLPEANHLPLNKNGHFIANPPSLGPSGVLKKMGLNRLPSPSEAAILSFGTRWKSIFPTNQNISKIIVSMNILAAQSASMAAFLANVSVRFTNIDALVVPTSALVASVPELSQSHIDTTHCWAHCSTCGYRLGRLDHTVAKCKICGSESTPKTTPDVIYRQIIANIANFEYRICGRKKPYQNTADQISSELTIPPPKRIHVSGTTSISTKKNPILDRINLLQCMSNDGSFSDRLKGFDPEADVSIAIDDLI